MSKKRDYYKIVCTPLKTILLVKKLTLDEENRVYSALRDMIQTKKDQVGIEEYMEFVLDQLIVNKEELVNKLKDLGDEFEYFYDEGSLAPEIISAIYMCLLRLYPVFQLEVVCEDINKDLFMEDAGGFFKDLLEKQLGHPIIHKKLDWTLEEKEEKDLGVVTLEDINKIEDYIRKNLIGQEEAITSIVNALKLRATNLASFSSFYFIGPTGVGKTLSAKLLGKKLGGNFLKINCGEYSSGHEYAKLIGAPPGYIGHTDKSILAEKAEKSNQWIFLFDEIEKANPKFHDFLLSLLDDGTVTDNLGMVLDFSQSLFIFTSNQGIQDIRTGEDKVGFNSDVVAYDESHDEIMKSVKKQFSPEFLNRIDNFVFFNSLTKKDLEKVVKLELKDIPVRKTKALIAYIIESSFSEEYGARNVARFIKNNVSIKVAEEILNKRIPRKGRSYYTTKIVNNKITIVDTVNYEDKHELANKEKSTSSC